MTCELIFAVDLRIVRAVLHPSGLSGTPPRTFLEDPNLPPLQLSTTRLYPWFRTPHTSMHDKLVQAPLYSPKHVVEKQLQVVKRERSRLHVHSQY